MSNDTPNYPHFSTWLYMPNGAKVCFVMPVADWTTAYEGAKEFTDMLLAKGALLREPGLEAGEEKELIVTVMRREKPSDGTPIIDMYTAWKEGGDEPWGTYKYMHMYLGSPEIIAEFLQVSGIKSLDLIPLYDAQAPLKRTSGKRHPKEFTVPTPYYIVKKQGAEKTGSDGKAYKPWEFVRFENGSQPAQNAPKQAPAQPQAATQPTAPQENAVRAFNTLAVTTLKQQNGKPYYSIQTVEQVDVLTFSRDLFRALGFTDETTDKWANTVPFQDHVINARLMERKDKTGTYYAAIIPEITF